MTVHVAAGRLVLQDRPGPFWLLGGFLLAGSILTLVAAFGLVPSAEELGPGLRIGFAAGGCAGVLASLWWLRRSPLSRTEIEAAPGRMRIVRTGIGGREVREIAMADVRAVEVEPGEDDEGGEVVRPVAELRSGERVHLSLLWMHDRAGVERAVIAVTAFCGLGTPGAKGHETMETGPGGP